MADVRDMSVPTSPRPFARWSETTTPPLPDHVVGFLSDRLGPLVSTPALSPSDIDVPRPRLSTQAEADLRSALGRGGLRTDRVARLRHAAGASYDDLLRLRTGTGLRVPDAVAAPTTETEVVAMLRTAASHRIAVVPVGGGTSVVAGAEPDAPGFEAVVVADLSTMAGVVSVDPMDATATFLPGTTGPLAERILEPHNLTLGHVPQSWARATLGGYAATRSAGQSSAGHGRFDSMVVALRLATPQGVLAVGTGTPNAAGPDLRQLVLGSEGAFGIITEVTVRVRPLPSLARFEGWVVPSFDTGLAMMRTLTQQGPRRDSVPDVLRLSDEAETEVQLALRGPGLASRALSTYLRTRRRSHGSLLVMGWDGTEGTVAERRREAVASVKAHGGVALGRAAGEAWRRHRFDAPSQRDALMDAGVLVETLETAGPWSRVPGLHQAVRASLRGSLSTEGRAPLVLSHVSHVYPTGASLYVTVLAAAGDAPRQQWATAKRAVTRSLLEAGGTLTHHHGVGRDHAPWLDEEIGELGVDVLRAVKRTLDPTGVLNPGALLT